MVVEQEGTWHDGSAPAHLDWMESPFMHIRMKVPFPLSSSSSFGKNGHVNGGKWVCSLSELA